MRQTQRRLKSYKLYKRCKSSVDTEGNRITQYEPAVTIKAQVWSASDSVQKMMYGDRINSIMNMLYSGNEEIKKGDGIRIFNVDDDKPDYRVISVAKHPIKFIELVMI